ARSVAVGGAGGGAVLRRATKARVRLGDAAAGRAGRRAGADDSMVTAGNGVCAVATAVPAIRSASRTAAPINQPAWHGWLAWREPREPLEMSIVKIPATFGTEAGKWALYQAVAPMNTERDLESL
ncbi:MAG: hypothetical protein NT113_12350, partial [Hyphomicrobiales bacterium]|nr:hypothetical protein [Hyphomicrobiales bacterium]